jgi:uncharacterized protein
MFYLDTSAAVKLVVIERGSKPLRHWLAQHDGEIVSSDLLRTELLRATRRSRPDQAVQARAVLDALPLLTMSTGVFERAATLDPDVMRSMDALHLAAALEFGDDLEGIVTYDIRLAEAAERLGIRAVAPG